MEDIYLYQTSGFLFLIWIGFGVATSIVAARRGHSGCGGFGLGILLGPVGLVIELLRIPDRPALAPKSITKGEGKHCPYCAEIIRRAAIKCRYCGSDLMDEKAVEQSIAKGEIKRCLFCGELIKGYAVKCRYCVSDLGEDISPAESRSKDEAV